MDATVRRVTSRGLALAALLTALALPSAATAQEPPATIAVHAALGSCETTPALRICEIDVSFDAVPGARNYQTVISAPDGAVLIDSAAAPGATTYSVTYRGDGTYRVRVTAFGDAG